MAVSVISTVTIKPPLVCNPWRFAYSTLVDVVLSRNMRSGVVRHRDLINADTQYQVWPECYPVFTGFKTFINTLQDFEECFHIAAFLELFQVVAR
jgi:hypothetical protein